MRSRGMGMRIARFLPLGLHAYRRSLAAYFLCIGKAVNPSGSGAAYAIP